MSAWIAIDERMPKRNELVLLFVNGCMDVGKWGGKRWIDPYGPTDEEFFKVTHWMLLPEAPL